MTIDSLNRLIPLRQLIQINLQCSRLTFEQLLELLHISPHVRTFELHSGSIYPNDFTLLQQNRLFHLISDTNMVTNLTVAKEITLEKLRPLINLFPRLESFTMNCYEKDLKPIILFLLSKANNNTRHLSAICILEEARIYMAKLRYLIESDHLLQYYNLNQIDQKLYLWW